jgi:hypothetical protein
LFDIDKIAKSIVGFSDYFSLRILLLLLSCFFVYHYTWSDQYYVAASKIHSDLLSAIDAFTKDKVLAPFKLNVIVPFLLFFVLISLLDIHMKVLAFISSLFTFYVSLSFWDSYVVMWNESVIFREWKKVSGVYRQDQYRGMVIADFHDKFPPQPYTYGTLLSLAHYLKAYGLVLLFGAIFSPAIFVHNNRFAIFATSIGLIVASIVSEQIGVEFNYIKTRKEDAYKFGEFVRLYNATKQILNIEDAAAHDAPPKEKNDLYFTECFIPSIIFGVKIVDLRLTYDLRLLWKKLRAEYDAKRRREKWRTPSEQLLDQSRKRNRLWRLAENVFNIAFILILIFGVLVLIWVFLIKPSH